MSRIKIIPFGNIPDDILTGITEELRNSMNFVTETTLPMGIPKEFYNVLRRQYKAAAVLTFLIKTFPGKILAITDEDLYAEDLSFVFGQAQLPGNASLISIHRLNPSFYRQPFDAQILKERAIKEAKHEVGHMLGLKHCPNERCVMIFSNSVAHVDRKNKEFCDMCKLQLGVR